MPKTEEVGLRGTPGAPMSSHLALVRDQHLRGDALAAPHPHPRRSTTSGPVACTGGLPPARRPPPAAPLAP